MKQMKDLMQNKIQKKHKRDTNGQREEIIECIAYDICISAYNIENIENKI